MIRYSPKTATDGSNLHVISFDGPVSDTPAAITTEISRLLQNKAAPFFLTTVKDPLLRTLMENLGGQPLNTLLYFLLLKNDLDPQILDHWLYNPDIENNHLPVTIHPYVPEQLYEPVAHLMTTLMNNIIRENDLERFAETASGLETKMTAFKEKGIEMLLFLLANSENEIIGLSFVLIDPASTTAKQELTGILPNYQGKKLAFYLKALAIRETFDRYPHIEAIETNCYSTNHPIIHINKTLGYQPTAAAIQYRVPAPHAPL
jgi:hypothetical protein